MTRYAGDLRSPIKASEFGEADLRAEPVASSAERSLRVDADSSGLERSDKIKVPKNSAITNALTPSARSQDGTARLPPGTAGGADP